MTLEEHKRDIYQRMLGEVNDIREALAKGNKVIDRAISAVKSQGSSDRRENAGLDIAISDLSKAYGDITTQQVALSKFQSIEERDLFELLFPGVTPPENCLKYNSVGRAVLYSTLRLKLYREKGDIQELAILLLPAGFNFKTEGCCAVDNPAAKLFLNAKVGDVIPFKCLNGERVRYEVLEIL